MAQYGWSADALFAHRENALSMYFKLHVAHPYVTGDKKRLLANYIGETEKQVTHTHAHQS